jgi:thiamine-phosphate pyrophosphorylase
MRYYITDRRRGWFVEQAVAAGVEYIQIRERDLTARELLRLTRSAVADARGSRTSILVNDRADVALAAGAQGVHLRDNSPPPSVFKRLGLVVAVSCHTAEDVRRAESEGADFVVYGPVFASPGKGEPLGLKALAEVCAAASIPVFALGGVDAKTAPLCLEAGAAGVAGIRMFEPDR